jgi:hypothetical protein
MGEWKNMEKLIWPRLALALLRIVADVAVALRVCRSCRVGGGVVARGLADLPVAIHLGQHVAWLPLLLQLCQTGRALVLAAGLVGLRLNALKTGGINRELKGGKNTSHSKKTS